MRPLDANQTRQSLMQRASGRRVLALRVRRFVSLLASSMSAAGFAAAQPYGQSAPTYPYSQTQSPTASDAPQVTPVPYRSLPANPYGSSSTYPQTGSPYSPSTAAPQVTPIPYRSLPQTLPGAGTDAGWLTQALAAGRRGDGPGVRAAMSQISDPVGRKIALWALIDGAPTEVTFSEADAARHELAGWPREVKREEAAEALLPYSGLPSAQVIAWFGADKPRTGGGAQALALALSASGRPAEAQQVIRSAWRSLIFEQPTQNAILVTFGATLTPDDQAARVDLLLYGGHTAAAQDLTRFLPPDQQALAQARMALRRNDPGADALVAALPPALQDAPGIAYEKALRLRDGGMDSVARQYAVRLPDVLPDQSAAERLWKHGSMAIDALQQGDSRDAYEIAAHSGLTSGPNAAEAQFLAGWIALTRLHDPRLADSHFAKVAEAGSSPLTQSRGYYWRGRAAEAGDDQVEAQLYYGQAAAWPTTFYGQLAAVRAGQKTLSLGHDPEISAAARSAFEASDPVRALRYLRNMGATDVFRAFAADLADVLPSAADEALLCDLMRNLGEQQLSMRVVRNAAKRGFILPERGYPLATTPNQLGGAEPAFVLGITRQESSFDPAARSGAGARGMMQLMPGTAEGLARHLGVAYASYELDDPEYNMRLGSAYLGQLVDQFSGSYVMAAAAYNAGPGRPNQWVGYCGDPRSGGTDPLNFIECIPFSETRDYVMRVLEAMQVYRARLHGGSAPLTLESDLKRGAYGYR